MSHILRTAGQIALVPLAVSLLATLPLASLSGQEKVSIRETTCHSCTIERTRLAVLGDQEGQGVVNPIFRIAIDREGRYLLRSAYTPEEIQVFDPDGRIERVVGGYGDGPGEFRFIRDIVPEEKGVAVFDFMHRRLTRLDSALELVETFAAPYDPFTVVRMPGGGFAVSAQIRTRELAGAPIHVTDQEGRILRSFFEPNEVFRSDIPYSGKRLIAPGDGGSVWAMPRTEYRIDHWSAAGSKVREFNRSVSWFRPHARDIAPGQDEAPPPLVQGIVEDESGLLWTAVTVADADWRDGVEERPGDVHSAVVGNKNLYWDTVFEVIDPVSGEVLAATRVDEYAEHLLAGHPPRYATYRETGPHPVIEVWQLKVSGR